MYLDRHFELTRLADKFRTVFGEFQVAVRIDILPDHAYQQSLTKDGMQRTLFLITCGAEVLQFVMMITHHFGRLVTMQDIDDMLRFMMLVHLLNGLQGQLQQFACIHLLVGLTTVIAVTAFLLRIFLAEIVEQQFTPAYRTLRITLCLKQQLVTDADLFRRLVFLESTQTLDIIRAVETQTYSFTAVSTRTTGLLVISLQRFRDVVVYDEAHIGFIDTHTEGDRRYYHLHFLHQERILVGRTRGGIHTGMVRAGADTVHLQHLRQILHFLARQAIDDTALAFHPADETHQVFIHLFRLRSYFVIQVRTVETALENRGIQHAEVLLDIFLHFRRSRSRQRDDRRLTDTLHHTADLAVLRTEIMPPFRDTMRLIHGVERDLHALQEVHILRFL